MAKNQQYMTYNTIRVIKKLYSNQHYHLQTAKITTQNQMQNAVLERTYNKLYDITFFMLRQFEKLQI